MSRGPAAFKQTDVTALVKAVKAAGHEIAGVEFDPVSRKVRVLTTNGSNYEVPASEAATGNFFDEKLKNGNNGNSEPSSV